MMLLVFTSSVTCILALDLHLIMSFTLTSSLTLHSTPSLPLSRHVLLDQPICATITKHDTLGRIEGIIDRPYDSVDQHHRVMLTYDVAQAVRVSSGT